LAHKPVSGFHAAKQLSFSSHSATSQQSIDGRRRVIGGSADTGLTGHVGQNLLSAGGVEAGRLYGGGGHGYRRQPGPGFGNQPTVGRVMLTLACYSAGDAGTAHPTGTGDINTKKAH
jgi:hypothetical protein